MTKPKSFGSPPAGELGGRGVSWGENSGLTGKTIYKRRRKAVPTGDLSRRAITIALGGKVRSGSE